MQSSSIKKNKGRWEEILESQGIKLNDLDDPPQTTRGVEQSKKSGGGVGVGLTASRSEIFNLSSLQTPQKGESIIESGDVQALNQKLFTTTDNEKHSEPKPSPGIELMSLQVPMSQPFTLHTFDHRQEIENENFSPEL